MNIRRAIALCLGVYTLLSLPGLENLWWIDIRPLSRWLLAVPGLVFCVHGALGRWRCAVTVTVGGLMVLVIVNSVHFYHLPRIKLIYRRAGRTAYTVPADEAYTVRQTPYLVAREVAGFWWYFLRTLA